MFVYDLNLLFYVKSYNDIDDKLNIYIPIYIGM